MTRVCLYTRISTDEENQPTSLASQHERLEAFCKVQEDWRIIAHHEDRATGTKLDRPGLQAALDLARQGRIDQLLVYRIDRLSRKVRQLAAIAEDRREEARTHPRRLGQADHGPEAQSEEDARRRDGIKRNDRWLGVRAHRDRRRDTTRLRGGTHRRESDHSDRVPAQSDRVLQTPRHAGPASCSPTTVAAYRSAVHAHRVPVTRDSSPTHAPLPATDQRKGRALHPHHARRLGLRRDLRVKHRAHRSP